jgi:hypothetical protein
MLESDKREREKDLAGSSQDSARSGTPDCPVVHRTVSGAPGQLRRTSHSGNSSAAYDYDSPDCPVVHRTVR